MSSQPQNMTTKPTPANATLDWASIDARLDKALQTLGWNKAQAEISALLREVAAAQPDDARVHELSLLVGRLAYALKKRDPQHPLPAQASRYLREKSLLSPLRGHDATADSGPTNESADLDEDPGYVKLPLNVGHRLLDAFRRGEVSVRGGDVAILRAAVNLAGRERRPAPNRTAARSPAIHCPRSTS